MGWATFIVSTLCFCTQKGKHVSYIYIYPCLTFRSIFHLLNLFSFPFPSTLPPPNTHHCTTSSWLPQPARHYVASSVAALPSFARCAVALRVARRPRHPAIWCVPDARWGDPSWRPPVVSHRPLARSVDSEGWGETNDSFNRWSLVPEI